MARVGLTEYVQSAATVVGYVIGIPISIWAIRAALIKHKLQRPADLSTLG